MTTGPQIQRSTSKGRVSTTKTMRWRSAPPLLLAYIMMLALPLPLPAVAAMSWTCSLIPKPLLNISISSSEQQEIVQPSNEGNRNLLRAPQMSDAIVLPGGFINRRATVDTSSHATSLFDLSSATPVIVYHEVRQCSCANDFLFNNGLLDKDEEFYCPTPTNQCSVWITRTGDDYDYGVRCFRDMSWAATTARQLWYYIVFWFVLLLLYPIFTRPGHVSSAIT